MLDFMVCFLLILLENWYEFIRKEGGRGERKSGDCNWDFIGLDLIVVAKLLEVDSEFCKNYFWFER